MKPGRNDPCICGSGKKYKNCCEGKALSRPAAPSPAEFNQLVALYNTGRYAELESRTRSLVEQYPGSGFSWKLLGVALLMQGKEALPAFQKTAKLLPDDAEAHFNLGVVLKNLGRLDDAVASYRRALKIKPDYAEALNNLGNAQKDLGLLDGAVASLRRALKIKPDYAEALNNLGNAQKSLGLLNDAIANFRRALEIKPNYAEAHSNLGNAQKDLRLLDDAVASYRRALEINPNFAEVNYNLGAALFDLGLINDAVASLRRALEIRPDFAGALNNLGNAQSELGLLNDAEASYRRALEIEPGYAEAYSNLLFTLICTAGHSPSYYLEEARQYGRMAANKVAPQFTSWQCAHHPERLRVGIVSGDLRAHPVGYFLEGLLAKIDPARIDLIAYTTTPKFDQLSARIKPSFGAWKPLFGLNDEAAAQLIHADGVHVLIDLSGHTAHNRLQVFAWKPAPVQITWIGLPVSTGLTEMDYILGDPFAIPVEDEGNFSERVWRLPESYLCFAPPDAALDVGTLPALTSGFVTFASFNNLTKMSDETVAVWARVLQAVPDSRLFLKTKQLKSSTVFEATLRRFDAHGISSDRLILEGFSAPKRTDHLATYQLVDIALDPFPYRGVTTSVEALWMGVPVITLRGDRFLSRTAESIAHNAGLADWIAADEDDYVAKAIFHSANLERLAILRAGLRKQVLSSPLFDAARFARNVEDALWGMWQAHTQRT